MEPARVIRDAIEKYRTQVIPLFEEGYVGVSGMEIKNSIAMLQNGYKNIADETFYHTFKEYTIGLIARFELFSKYALEEEVMIEERKENVRRVMGGIEERINLVEISVDSLLESRPNKLVN